VARVNADGVQQLTDTVNWTNLNSFFGRGSKILYFHGTSDPWFSAYETLHYYQRMAKDSGGMETVRAQSSRFYFVPGMDIAAAARPRSTVSICSAPWSIGSSGARRPTA